jgi:hypothetical protein
MPTPMPVITRRDGDRRQMADATMAVNRGLAPFSIPVSADVTCRSANGNMVSGNASQSTPSETTPFQSEREMGFRADGNRDSVTRPIDTRTKVIPKGPTARIPSAMNRNDAPQIRPGTASNNHSALSALKLTGPPEKSCVCGMSVFQRRQCKRQWTMQEGPFTVDQLYHYHAEEICVLRTGA